MRRWSKQDREAELAKSERKCEMAQAFSKVCEDGDVDQIRSELQRLRQENMGDCFFHMLSCTAWLRLGDETAAFAELTLAFASDPDIYPLYLKCAGLFMRRGDREAAKFLLDKAWEHAIKYIPKNLQEEEKERLYSILDRKPKSE